MNVISSLKKAGVIATAFSIAMIFATACETLDSLEDMDKPDRPKDKAIYVVSVHEIVKYPRAQSLEMNIPSFSGTPVCINTNYFLHSKHITAIEIVEEKDKPGFYDLILSLDRRGRMLWSALSVNFRNTQMAFVIDGVYYRSFSPEQLGSDEDVSVKIKGPFDLATAEGLKRNSEKNHKLFNDDKK